MLNFISSETVMLISFICSSVPNLYRGIMDYSTPESKKHRSKTSAITLTPGQIDEARMHRSTIIFHALNAIATIQNTINITDDKIDELTKQRGIIENTLVSLLSLNENTNTSEIPSDTTENIKQQLIDLNKKRKELESIKEKLKQEMLSLNEMIAQHDAAWLQHRKKYNNELVKQLENLHGITLTTEEKGALNDRR